MRKRTLIWPWLFRSKERRRRRVRNSRKPMRFRRHCGTRLGPDMTIRILLPVTFVALLAVSLGTASGPKPKSATDSASGSRQNNGTTKSCEFETPWDAVSLPSPRRCRPEAEHGPEFTDVGARRFDMD